MTIYKGYDVMLTEPDRADDIAIEIAGNFNNIDYATGKFIRDYKGKPAKNMTLKFVAVNATQSLEIEIFLLNKYGRLTPFWIPTWKEDAQVISNTSTSIMVKKWDLELTRQRRNIVILGNDGVFYLGQINNIDKNGNGTSTLHLNINLPEAGINFVSLLLFVRLNSDTLEIKKITKEASIIQTNIIELPEEYPLWITQNLRNQQVMENQ